jgi:dUTP pyrophosphatase
MDIRVLDKSKHPLPEYATDFSAEMDIRTNIDENIVLKPLNRSYSKNWIIFGDTYRL